MSDNRFGIIRAESRAPLHGDPSLRHHAEVPPRQRNCVRRSWILRDGRVRGAPAVWGANGILRAILCDPAGRSSHLGWSPTSNSEGSEEGRRSAFPPQSRIQQPMTFSLCRLDSMLMLNISGDEPRTSSPKSKKSAEKGHCQ